VAKFLRIADRRAVKIPTIKLGQPVQVYLYQEAMTRFDGLFKLIFIGASLRLRMLELDELEPK